MKYDKRDSQIKFIQENMFYFNFDFEVSELTDDELNDICFYIRQIIYYEDKVNNSLSEKWR
jgi:hypothetical protein